MRAVYVYICLGIVGLVLMCREGRGPSPSHGHSLHRRVGPGRRIKLRSSFSYGKHEPVAFDPLIAEMERLREDREWEKHYIEEKMPMPKDAPGAEAQPEWEDFMNAEDYVNDEERFNVSARLVTLFPNVDVNPADGFLSNEELTEWHLSQALRQQLHRTQRDMEMYDKNRDGFVSFQEYEPPSWVRDSVNISAYGVENGWWMEEHYNASDEDGDGLLNQTEFNDFLHPADSKNPNLVQWLCKEEVRERDSDKDGKLNFKEFYHGLFDLIRNYDEDTSNESPISHGYESMREAAAKKLFSELDKNNDGFLTYDELQPVINRLHPGEEYYAKQQADYMIMQADADKDGRLSLKEVLDHPYVFYSAIFTDENDEDYYRDEFR
uniref:EF-hand domain-containing protein n=1 Tax=Araucaria cunninghamii TaxID=56994 RepID=A0A0D6R4P1_ARACU